ncbi:cytochrome c oxidase subunit 3 [Thalassococcus sp. BH17M4-6]|uniref:cytochrome c oxidase subunit 3 n=1 Tax=Thalassococcus sp. BH17M4-6 TaxID=3413148 RepID=UPI003BD68A28
MTTSTAHPKSHPGLNLGPAHGQAHKEAETVVFGFWIFLMSDLVTFAMFFATYAVSIQATAGGPGNADIVDITSIGLQTGALLISSLLFGIATVAMKHGASPRSTILWLLASLAFGLCFLGLELRDFHDAAEKGTVPMRSGYLSAYWALVGLHGLHVTVGSIMICVVCAQIAIFGFADDVKTRVLRLGLYWHFLDIIWIGIFSVVFLPGLLT